MLFTSYCRSIVASALLLSLSCGCAAQADVGGALNAVSNQVSERSESREGAPIEIACSLCGCSETSSIVGVEATTIRKHKQELLTDSLWGNLILEMAYQRDDEIKKISKRLGLVNLGTMVTISAIAGGALAQGIDSLYMLNPPDGHLDSYTPGIMGVALSGCTLLTFGARSVIQYKYQRALKARQRAIKKSVEEVLAHLEYSEAGCAEAQTELTKLIGERATGEFLQLWRSSHTVAAKPSHQG